MENDISGDVGRFYADDLAGRLPLMPFRRDEEIIPLQVIDTEERDHIGYWHCDPARVRIIYIPPLAVPGDGGYYGA